MADILNMENNHTIQQNEENIHTGEPYLYQPLPPIGVNKNIRLLELLPGTALDDVQSVLFTVDLGDCPEYEALSYCWGEEIETTPIQVNEQTLYITKTLRSALFRLRNPDRSRTIWVDAICINQDDIEERGEQVKIMREIYSSASRTVVWLGVADEDSDTAFDICEQLVEDAQTPGYSGASFNAENNAPERTEIDKNDESVPNLLARSWWTRVWVVQEIVLAKDALVVCGKKEMDWRQFCLAIETGRLREIWETLLLGLVEGNNDFSFYQSIATMQRPVEADSVADQLLGLLIHVRQREATDARDKVFSVLGMLGRSPKELGIVPDYHASAENIFTNTAVAIIKGSGHLDILGLAITNVNSPNLPSWIPSWDNTGQIPSPLRFDARGKRRTTSASGGSLATPDFVNDTVLVLSGHRIDDIQELAEVLPRVNEDDWEDSEDLPEDAGVIASLKSAFNDFSGISRNLLSLTLRLTTFINWETFADISKNDQEIVYWRTVSGADTLDDSGTMEASYKEWYASLAPVRKLIQWRIDKITPAAMFKSFGFIGYLRTTWEKYPEFGRLVAAHATGRRLAKTGQGSLCLVPAETVQGDSIILVKGGRFPLVVRGVGEHIDGKKEWNLVGECYMHGIMNGEAFLENNCVDIRIR
jgi:hypothetical protein